MFHDYQVKQLVSETIDSVLETAMDFSDETTETIIHKKKTKKEKKESSCGSSDEHTGDEIGDDEHYDIYDMPQEDVIEEEEDFVLDLQEGDLARAHWIQLQKTNKQGIVVQNALIHILSKYKHIRPIWQFGKHIDDSKDEWKTELYQNFYFRHHCAEIQAAITMVMENKDDSVGMRKLLNEIGAHHFFYDTCEPHLEVFQEAIIESMKKVLHGVHELDESTTNSWRSFLSEIKVYISEGIAIQRSAYLKQCMTKNEIDQIRQNWASVVEYGLPEAGQLLCEKAMTVYPKLLREHHICMPIPQLTKHSETFQRFAEMTVLALDQTINSYDEERGFRGLPDLIRDYVITCMVLEVSPPLVRKAFMEALITMLSKVVGQEEVTENFVHAWSKIYRVLEQAVITNIVEY